MDLTCDEGVNFLDEFLLLFGLEVSVPFRQAGLARPVLDQDELDRHYVVLSSKRLGSRDEGQCLQWLQCLVLAGTRLTQLTTVYSLLSSSLTPTTGTQQKNQNIPAEFEASQQVLRLISDNFVRNQHEDANI